LIASLFNIDNSSEEYVTTKDGSLVISVKAVKTKWTEWDENNLKPVERTKNYTSGMVQSWNKFCFTGGVLQMAIRLPGRHDSGGFKI
jgi:beta-glucanase (GH16 family)